MPLVDRIERRVSATFMLMSYSGRVTLINSLLTSIATFPMFLASPSKNLRPYLQD
jgi:hypothetical protein